MLFIVSSRLARAIQWNPIGGGGGENDYIDLGNADNTLGAVVNII